MQPNNNRYSTTVVALIFIFASHIVAQQRFENVWSEIEKNNTTLAAYRSSAAAEKTGNKTGIYLQNPELEFNYLWGSPSAIGNRTDFSVRQSFDFPTAYTYRKQMSALKNTQVDLSFKKQLIETKYQVQLLCARLTYANALGAELGKRFRNASEIARVWKLRFEKGDVNVLEYNKSQVNLLTLTKSMEMNRIEQQTLLNELKMLNGGIDIAFNDSIFEVPVIQSDFEQWYAAVEAGNPVLQWIKQEISINRKQKQLNTALTLPGFNAGYMSEKVVGQQYSGISVGISIPLWENKNTIRYAREKTRATEDMEKDARMQFYQTMNNLHTKAIGIQHNVFDYEQELKAFSNDALLSKALDKGEISLSEYFFELSLYYESVDKLLELKMNLAETVAGLNRYY